MICTMNDCPGNLTLPASAPASASAPAPAPAPHQLGDDKCGYLSIGKPKNNRNLAYCRRPACAIEFLTPESRLLHEANRRLHGDQDMDYICDWDGHADAIDEAGICPVCQ